MALNLFYSANDFGVSDYRPAQDATRSNDDTKVVEGKWMVPLYASRSRNGVVKGYISWSSIATTKKTGGKLSVHEHIVIIKGNKAMTLNTAYTNNTGYYKPGQKQRALITQGSLSNDAVAPLNFSGKAYAILVRDSNSSSNWRKVRLLNAAP